MGRSVSRVVLGISACLLGEKVRYDGGHKLDRWIRDTLGRFVRFLPVCPEMECGMGVPREAIRLSGDPDHPRLVGIRSQTDHTQRMSAFCSQRVQALHSQALSGFLLKARSPSCGVFRVKVYAENGMPEAKGKGFFARALTDAMPLLPIEEEGRLHDPDLRENFITRLFTMERWRGFLASGASRGGLVDFHTRHKLLLLAHDQQRYRKMGRLVAEAKQHEQAEAVETYQALLMEALRLRSTPAKNVNALQHAVGFLKQQLSPDERHEFQEILSEYRAGYVPLVVPMTLLNHHIRKHGQSYLAGQWYLRPHPVELALRNHV